MSIIIGISAFYHDSAAALIVDGKVIAAAQEERFTRNKNTHNFPINAIRYCLTEAKINISQVDVIAFYEKPKLKFRRFISSHIQFFPFGYKQFLVGILDWVYINYNFEKEIIRLLKPLSGNGCLKKIKVLFSEHHLSHAASSYYCSNFEDAAVLTIDGVGELSTTTIYFAEKEKIKKIKEIRFPNSIGLLYSSFTHFLGFKVNSGEYKLMGLASYGNPTSEKTLNYIRIINEKLLILGEDGSYKLNMDYFKFHIGLEMFDELHWKELFGFQKRNYNDILEQKHCDLALAIQTVTEILFENLVKETKNITKTNNLCLAGGVALNCVANGKIIQSEIFKNIYIQPASGDAGGALGAALAVNYLYFGNKLALKNDSDKMSGAYLGPCFDKNYIISMADSLKAKYEYFLDFGFLASQVADLINHGKIIGWFQGRMEFGPRALGNRSILADPRDVEMQKRLNISIKKREGFRPFAPAVLESASSSLFKLDKKSPYMQFVTQIVDEIKIKVPENFDTLTIWDKLYLKKSKFPAITHVDMSARFQTVNKESNERFYKLLEILQTKYEIPLVINTSFNVRGEPIVCTPDDAYDCFMNTEIDYLVIENFIFDKKVQPMYNNLRDFKLNSQLD